MTEWNSHIYKDTNTILGTYKRYIWFLSFQIYLIILRENYHSVNYTHLNHFPINLHLIFLQSWSECFRISGRLDVNSKKIRRTCSLGLQFNFNIAFMKTFYTFKAISLFWRRIYLLCHNTANTLCLKTAVYKHWEVLIILINKKC